MPQTHMQNKEQVTADDPNTYSHREVITCRRKAVGKIQQKNILMKHILKKKHQVRPTTHIGYWELLI
jgi:hypothetical protein